MTDDIKEKRRASEEKIARGEYDVFLCYNSKDREEVKTIANWLKDNGIAPWLDQWDLQPGLSWQRLVEKQIKTIKSAAVFVGKKGTGPQQEREVYAFLSASVSGKCSVIPVLLQNAPYKPKLSPFLKENTWVDFRTNNPDPLEHLIWGITGKKPTKVYRPGILIASLGDSPVVVSAMYDLLKKREKLTLDRVMILHPKDNDILAAYKLVREILTDVQELQSKPLDFEDADSWTNACVFLKTLCELLRNYQKQGDSVYLSLAGGRKSMAALMAWVAPYFSCVKKLYHVVSDEEGGTGEENFPLVYDITRIPTTQRFQALHPDLDHLSLVKIPVDMGQPIGEKFLSKLSSSLPEDFEEAEAMITGQTIFQEENILKVEVTPRVIEQFRALCKANIKDAWIVRNSLLRMSQIATLRGHEAGSASNSYEVPKKIRNLRDVTLHSFTGLSVPIRPIFYTEPVDIYTQPAEPVERVVICSLEREDEHGYKMLEELALALASTARQTSSIDRLSPVADPAESVLIVPLGTSPMVATQLYALLTKVEQRTIREVVLIYPQKAATIANGAEMIKKALRVEDENVACRLADIEGLADITEEADCRKYQARLEQEIERVKNECPGIKIDLALSGGRKGMTAMTIFAAQKHRIPYVYHTLITDGDMSEKIEGETTYEELNDTGLSQEERNARLFLCAYKAEEPDPYANFSLFRVPVFTADGW